MKSSFAALAFSGWAWYDGKPKIILKLKERTPVKKPLPLLLSICLLLTACGQAAPEPESGRLKIVTTVFPAYDFARAAAGGLADDADAGM